MISEEMIFSNRQKAKQLVFKFPCKEERPQIMRINLVDAIIFQEELTMLALLVKEAAHLETIILETTVLFKKKSASPF